MSPLRYQQLMNDLEEKLTAEEVAEGWHFCYDWDGLLIHKNDPEAKCCTCQRKNNVNHPAQKD